MEFLRKPASRPLCCLENIPRLLCVEEVGQILNVLLAEANAEPVVVEEDDVAHGLGLPAVEERSASANAAERRDLELAEVAAFAGDPADAGVGSLVFVVGRDNAIDGDVDRIAEIGD